ncbi:MAG: radical SAM protein [Desulfomonilaceae bacterium]
MRVFVKGFNTCIQRKQKLSQYRRFLVANGHELVDSPDACDAILVWTCGFRGDVRDNSVSQIENYRRAYSAELIVTGCLPDICPELVSGKSGTRLVKWRDDERFMELYFGTGAASLKDVPQVFVEAQFCEDATRFREDNPGKDACFHDQFIKLVVSEGCTNKCSYCSERLAFPPPRSFPVDDLVQACREMVRKRYKRVVLIADCVGEYGRDIGSSLSELINRLSEIDPELRVALNNYNVVDLIRDWSAIRVFLENGICSHLNLPIQSASDMILSLMNRPYSRADLDRAFASLKEINFKDFDTHIIVGFPGEREEDVRETIAFLIRQKVKYVLASKYMETSKAPSARLPGKVDSQTVQERLDYVERELKRAGILCSAEGGRAITERLTRINVSS